MRMRTRGLPDGSALCASIANRSGDRQRAGLWMAFALALIVAPWLFPSAASLTLLCQIGTAGILALSFNLLLGQTGMLSFCHATYAGFGAFAAVWCMHRIGGGWAVPMALVPLAGGLAGALGGAALGFVTTRRTGLTFAMITLGVAELVWVGATMLPEWFGGERGIAADRTSGAAWFGLTLGPQRNVYFLVAAWLFVCALAMYCLTRTPLGYLARAVRDNEVRVAFLGPSPATVRYRMQILATFFAGVAGGLNALNFELVSADAFSLERSGAVLVFTVLGGTGYFAGPLIGAASGVFATIVLSGMTRAWQLYLGLAFLVVVVFAPGGLAGIGAAHVRACRVGRWRKVWRPYLAVVIALALLLAGGVALIEMAYHVRLDVETVAHAPFWLGGFDAHHPVAWALAAAYGISGFVALRLSWPALAAALRASTAPAGPAGGGA